MTAVLEGKYQRTYELQVQGITTSQPNLFAATSSLAMTTGGVTNNITVKYPLTVDFQIEHKSLATASLGHFLIYNLAPETRAQLFHDRFETYNYRQVIMNAGYQVGFAPYALQRIFQGNASWIYSYRRGADYITEIEAYDGLFGIQNCDVAVSQPAPYTFRNVLTQLIESMQHTTPGAIGNLQNQNSRGLSLCGNAYDLMKQAVHGIGGELFIEHERVNALQKYEYIATNPDQVFLISSDTGLLNTPKRYGKPRIQVEIVFEPRIRMGQLVQVDSVEPANNGLWVVKGISHRGRISASSDAGATTTLDLFNPGLGLLQEVEPFI